MVALGTQNVLRINNFPVTRSEKEQYVPTALVPNVANSLNDDIANETAGGSTMLWPYKPILFVATKQSPALYVAHTIETHFAIEVTFRGLR